MRQFSAIKSKNCLRALSVANLEKRLKGENIAGYLIGVYKNTKSIHQKNQAPMKFYEKKKNFVYVMRYM